MAQSNVDTAEAYYKTMSEKDLACMAKHLHPKVQLIGPLSNLSGKERVLDAAKSLVEMTQGPRESGQSSDREIA